MVKALVGTNLTLGITYTVTEPQVSWWKDGISIATRTVDNGVPPQIDPQYKDVLVLKEDGSLSFSNVTLEYSGIYNVIVVKVGAGQGEASFTLMVYGKIKAHY